jgi:hypothetical protein
MVSFEVRVKGLHHIDTIDRNLNLNVRGKLAPLIAEEGFDFAVEKVPKDTGALLNALQLVTTKQTGKVIQRLPRHSDGRNRPYHLWMARKPAATMNAGKFNNGRPYRAVYDDVQHVKSNTRYMEYTFEHMKKEAPKIAKRQIEKSVKGV